MHTLLLVENASSGFQLARHNFYRVPPGRIRIARYTTAFWPSNGFGYYGDIYLRAFIRKWKYISITRKRRIFEKKCTLVLSRNTPLVMDTLSVVASFL